jgi:chorismate mutase
MLKKQIELRIDELSREIRGYPTPIARCDEQLAQLLEERSLLISKLRTLEEKQNDGGFNAA